MTTPPTTPGCKAKGRDTGGRGNAEADIVADAEALSPTSTKCTVTADLHITGKVAQFGRGIMGDVSKKLMDQFAGNLNRMLDDQGGAPRHRSAAARRRRSAAPTRRPTRAGDGAARATRHRRRAAAPPSARSTVRQPSRSTSPASPDRQ